MWAFGLSQYSVDRFVLLLMEITGLGRKIEAVIKTIYLNMGKVRNITWPLQHPESYKALLYKVYNFPSYSRERKILISNVISITVNWPKHPCNIVC